MFKYKQITDVLGRSILDGRGLPAIEVEVLGEDGEIGRGAVSLPGPEDNLEELAESLALFINRNLADKIIGENLLAQKHVDQILERSAGGVQEMQMRKYAIRAISCAAARTATKHLGIPLYQYLGGVQAQSYPILRIGIPEEKTPGARCQILMDRWKKRYEKTEIGMETLETKTEKVIHPEQYITVTQCMKEIRAWKEQGEKTIVIKDGEYVLDAFLVDLAVASGADVLELRPPVRGENTVKYSRLMRILEHL